MMLDIQMIGEKAGKVWQYLDKHRDASRAELKRALGLTDLEVGTALGWLAKEDKLYFMEARNSFRVRLA